MNKIPAYVPCGTVLSLPVAWDDMPLRVKVDSGYVAVMYDARTCEPVDAASNFDTAESMALEGYIPVPVGKRGLTKYGSKFRYLVDIYNDCWGR